MNMKISIIIPNYNGRVLLEKNLPEVIKNSPAAEIIVVDDASGDDSVFFLKKNFPGIKIIGKNKNTGFSSTVNTGVEKAKGDLIILLNTDVYPKKDYVKPLLSYFNDPLTFAVGMLQESHEGGKIIKRGRGEGEFKKGFLIHRRGQIDKNDTLWVSGGAGIFRKSIWEKLGGFDEIFDPFYWEDIDLSFRAVKKGYKIWFEKNSVVVHRQSQGSIRNEYNPSRIKTIAYRNQFYFVRKNLTGADDRIAHYIWLPYHFINALKSGDWPFFMGFFPKKQ